MDVMQIVGLGIAFVVGLAVGFSFHSFLVEHSKKKEKERLAELKKQKKKVSMEEKYAHEVYDFMITPSDIERGTLVSVRNHLADVVEEALHTGKFGHRLRMVFMGLPEKDVDLEKNEDLLKYIVTLHRELPHLPIWLDPRSTERYMRLLYFGLQVEDSKITSWGLLLDDIADRADTGIGGMVATADQDIAHDLAKKGVAELKKTVAKLDHTADSEEESEETASAT